MKEFEPFLNQIDNPQNGEKLAEVLAWIGSTFPTLSPRIAWNQPMFTDHGTFIIAFSAAKKHFAVGPEKEMIARLSAAIVKAGYEHSDMLFRIKWTDPVDYALLADIIRANMLDKAECKTLRR
ncbi:MAG: DUF1801 domain-containing protein [Candidatus Moduliflexus flocculans]|nr:DUF1801 domain-containing protein [Candidatus Moduliflexus flocculans]